MVYLFNKVTLKSITKLCFVLLLVNLVLKLMKTPILPLLFRILTTCPANKDVCIFWWQKYSIVEPWVWRLIDYIDSERLQVSHEQV
ncbi:hypothetical protein KDRO_B06020 [Kluyveromyces lactis]|nr:hypothetical protein KDRO_B06020 [Kluyveromyces lactis]